MSAIPTESFLFMPPDSARACVCRLSVSPIHSIILSTSSFTRQDGQFFNLEKNHRCSSTVRRSNNTSCCGQRPERQVSYVKEAQRDYTKIIKDSCTMFDMLGRKYQNLNPQRKVADHKW